MCVLFKTRIFSKYFIHNPNTALKIVSSQSLLVISLSVTVSKNKQIKVRAFQTTQTALFNSYSLFRLFKCDTLKASIWQNDFQFFIIE